MQVETTRFGPIEINEDLIIQFPRGIPGFENLRRFIVIPVEGAENLHWLQAVDAPTVALLVIDPFRYFKGYSCDIPENDIEELDIKEQKEILLLTTVTIPRANPAEATANLVAPIVINTKINRAKQIILNNSPYTTRHRIFPDTKHNSSANNEDNTISCSTGGV